MKKIRSIRQAFLEIKEKDPNSAITVYAIRNWIASGQLPCIKSGRRILIDMDIFEEFLSGERYRPP